MLCGGASRRMGRDKAFVPFAGVAMVQRVADTLRHAGCDTVVAIGGDAVGLAAAGLVTVPDEHPGEGPLGAVICALHQLSDNAVVVVTACDLPLLSAPTVAALVQALASADPSVGVVMARTDRREPLCAAWRPRCVEILREQFAAGERRLGAAADAVGVQEWTVPAGDLVNVNTPADLPQ